MGAAKHPTTQPPEAKKREAMEVLEAAGFFGVVDISDLEARGEIYGHVFSSDSPPDKITVEDLPDGWGIVSVKQTRGLHGKDMWVAVGPV